MGSEALQNLIQAFVDGSVVSDHNITKSLIAGFSGFIETAQVAALADGSALFGQTVEIPLQPDQLAVLVKEGIVFRSCDTATAGGDDAAGFFA